MDLGLCLEMALTKFPFAERVQKAAQTGFKFVEMWWVDGSFKGSPVQLAKLASDNGVKITNTVVNSPDGSIGGGLTDPRQGKDTWLNRTRMTLTFNKEAQIPASIVLTGNRVEGLSDRQMMDSVIEWLKPAVDIAEKTGVTLLLECLNDKYDHPGYWLTSSDLGAEICRQIGSSRLRVLFDCYHMQIMEGDLVKHIERNLDMISHFHSAGVPGRNEHFKGEVNYPFVISAIERLGHQGVFGLEFAPSMDDETSLKQVFAHLSARA